MIRVSIPSVDCKFIMINPKNIFLIPNKRLIFTVALFPLKVYTKCILLVNYYLYCVLNINV